MKKKAPAKLGKRGTLRKVYEKDGEAAAIAAGEEIGVRSTRVRRWIRTWTRNQPRAPEPEPERVVVEETTTKRGPLIEGKTICFTWDHSRRAKLISLGPQQSVIKFKNGNVRTVKTNEIMPVPDDDDALTN